jgi:hypothetical protein
LFRKQAKEPEKRRKEVYTEEIVGKHVCTGHACGCVPLHSAVKPGSASWMKTTPIAHRIVTTDELDSLSEDNVGFASFQQL